MKAVICTRYGPPEVLILEEVKKPTPKPNEVLIRVIASSITMADVFMRKGTPYYARLFLGLTKPRHPIPGTGFAGVVESVGASVKSFKEGDLVFGESGLNFGAYAEYVCLPDDALLATKASGLTFAEAACVCDGPLTSFAFLQKVGSIRRGQNVLINGASGSLGTAAVQLAKIFEAEVTGVCSTGNVALVKSLGADRVVDYTKEDFTAGNEQYDIVFDTIGKSSFPRCKRVLKDGGLYLSPVLTLPLLFQMMWTSRLGKRKAKFSATGLRPASELRILLDEVKGLLEAKRLKIVMDRRFPIEQIVEAHRYVEAGHKRGNVVINIHPE